MNRLTILIFLLMPLAVISQKKLTIEDASGMNRAVMPQSLKNLQWMGASDRFTYAGQDYLLRRTPSGTLPDTLIRLADINRSLKAGKYDTLSRLPFVTWVSDQAFTFSSKNKIFLLNPFKKSFSFLNEYPENAENLDISSDGKLIAYTTGNNLFIADSGRQVQVTTDENPGLVNGQTVHRNEFGIDKGTFWSESGNYLAYYRKDETMVTEYPIVDVDTRIASVTPTRYPMAGMTSEQVTLVVYELSSGRKTVIQTGEPADQYLASVTWSPDERYIYIAQLNREQNHLKLNRYDTQSGLLDKTLFEEKNDKYVEPEHPLYFINNHPDRFIWISERDGYQHLYLYDTSGALIRQLTQGPWVVTEFLGTDPKGERFFFLATKNSPLNQDVFTTDLKTGKILPLSLNTGTHSPILSPSGKYFLDVYQDTVTSREYAVVDTRGKVMQVIFRSENTLNDYQLGKTSIFTLRSGDGTDLYCRMITPPGFDPSRKYPLILYVYGGPHTQLITNSWLAGAGLYQNYLAQQGYIVFTLDNRGSANRGRDFEQTIHRRLGTIEAEDQMIGVNYLLNLPFIDPNRVGVHGWSYGGFMTINLMLRYPDVFAAGVCGGPVTDWKYYEVMYGERYMDTPEENPGGYLESSLIEKAGNLKGDLLIIHGTADPVVVWQHSLALLKSFVSEGILADYFVYPGHEHGVGGKDRLHLNRLIERYFNEHLPETHAAD
jgi:dipeptidyl-peptidase-4